MPAPQPAHFPEALLHRHRGGVVGDDLLKALELGLELHKGHERLHARRRAAVRRQRKRQDEVFKEALVALDRLAGGAAILQGRSCRARRGRPVAGQERKNRLHQFCVRAVLHLHLGSVLHGLPLAQEFVEAIPVTHLGAALPAQVHDIELCLQHHDRLPVHARRSKGVDVLREAVAGLFRERAEERIPAGLHHHEEKVRAEGLNERRGLLGARDLHKARRAGDGALDEPLIVRRSVALGHHVGAKRPRPHRRRHVRRRHRLQDRGKAPGRELHHAEVGVGVAVHEVHGLAARENAVATEAQQHGLRILRGPARLFRDRAQMGSRKPAGAGDHRVNKGALLRVVLAEMKGGLLDELARHEKKERSLRNEAAFYEKCNKKSVQMAEK